MTAAKAGRAKIAGMNQVVVASVLGRLRDFLTTSRPKGGGVDSQWLLCPAPSRERFSHTEVK